jgi:predicted amidohydrolase
LIIIRNAEYFDGSKTSPTLDLLKNAAKSHKMYILAGVPEIGDHSKLYNSAILFNP